MSHSFAPLTAAQAAALSQATGVDFTRTLFASPDWLCVSRETSFVCVFEMQQPWDAHISVMCRDPRAVTRRMLRATFTAVFSQAKRVTALIEPGNGRANNLAVKLGFQPEGFVRLGIAGERDAVMYGMLRSECPWLKKSPPLPQLDLADGNLMDTKVGGNPSLGSRVRSDRDNIGSGQLRHLVAFAALVVGVISTLGDVALPARPPQVAGIDAAWIGAGMGGIAVPIGLAVGEAADDPMHLSGRAVVPHLRVAPLVQREGPEKAIITLVGERGVESVKRLHSLYNKEL